jgi:hypothetical protein
MFCPPVIHPMLSSPSRSFGCERLEKLNLFVGVETSSSSQDAAAGTRFCEYVHSVAVLAFQQAESSIFLRDSGNVVRITRIAATDCVRLNAMVEGAQPRVSKTFRRRDDTL